MSKFYIREAMAANWTFADGSAIEVDGPTERVVSRVVNIYRSAGEWCYALIVGGEHDHSDTLDVEDDASYSEAAAEASSQFPGAEVRRVEDVSL